SEMTEDENREHLLARRHVNGIHKWNVSLSRRFLKEMATGRKGSGTTRGRKKIAAKEAAATARESNGLPAHNGAAEARSYIEMNIETIRVRAYEIFRARGATHGDDLADWFNAERELRVARNH
ncbi:MAG: DUF2934 domain-containing protein, partial [Pseudomonadota bacterium]